MQFVTVSTLLSLLLVAFQSQTTAAFGLASHDTFHLLQTATSHVDAHVDLLSAYKHSLATNPLPTKMMTGATLAVCGDAIAQAKDVDNDYDKRRAASFAVFDMAYRALQHVSFPIIVAACQGQYLGHFDAGHVVETSQWAALEQTLASQLGIVPFMYYPAFFALTGAIQGLSVEGAVTRAKENFLPLMKRNLLFWIPVQFVQFGYIQEDLQIPFLSVCGLAWTFILSVAAGSAKSYNDDSTDIQDDGMEDKSVVQLQQRQQQEDEVVLDNERVLLGVAANATSC